MTPPEIEQALQSGIAAARRGQRAEARSLLLQVAAADEVNESAWLWLSAVLESLEDQITALENVLAINPDSAPAQQGLAQLRARRARRAVTPAPAQEALADTALADTALANSALASSALAGTSALDQRLRDYGDVAPIDSVSALDDPYQCVYCGAPAGPELKRCPECYRSLVVREGRGQLSAALRNAVFVVMTCVALAAVEAGAVAIFHYQGDAFGVFIFERFPIVGAVVGDFRLWPQASTPWVMWGQFANLALLVVVMLGLLYQVSLAYSASIGLLAADILWMVYRWRAGYFGFAFAAAEVGFSVAALFFVFAAQPDFQVNLTRLRCSTDQRIKGGEALNRLGHIAKGKDQWALAVAYWRAAVAAMPNQAGFYKDLAIGYAQIGYYERALKGLEEFARQAPDKSDFEPMQTLIRQKQARDPAPRG